MTKPSRHTEWLSLVEVSGPFLAVPVLEKAFPQGLDVVETPKRQRLRAAYEEWRDAVDDNDPLLADLHREWIRLVFTEILEYDGSTLKTDAETSNAYMVSSPERTETFVPDWTVVSLSGDKPRLFVSIQPPGTDFERVRKDDRWPASLIERMVALCRTHTVRLGVFTDGERWMLVNAPVGGMSSHASWYARLWFQEPVTLKAFQSLWSVRRCFGPSEETLEALLDRSLEHHEEITDTLGEQVRRAVEVLVQCLDKADADRNRELLRDVSPTELYEAGLIVMMRLVFVLCAEERGLLLLGDPVYDECYAVSTLRAQLAEEADRHGPEVLDRRHDAWARLLSVFRAVYGGIDHESLRMPALGGSLFDPDRFPFLEGRPKGTSWRDSDAAPLPIDNRTVLLLLNSLQLLEQHGGALLLSYRALDVEQIGHVYEGLLEHTVARMPSVTVGLVGSKKAKNPNLPLSEMESARMAAEDTLVSLVKETTERSEAAIRKALARPVDDALFGRLLAVCGGDTTLAERIRPFANLVRTDAWDDPIVYREGASMVTLGADRRETGTHYTPKSLTESIVETTLEPIVYFGPAEGKPREEWRLKTPAELLDLKICDMAMGSGAFLVQVCRYLAERLVEAWAAEEATGKFVTAEGEVRPSADDADPIPKGLDERLLIARRLIAERCLYGVDINPLAVELAKLSIWLVTLAKGRPFGFLDHNLRHGDSLLGIHRLDQLTKFKLNPGDGPYQQRIFGQNVAGAVAEAVKIRRRLRAIPIRDIRDVEIMALLDTEARKKLQSIEVVADAMIGEALRSDDRARSLDSALDSLAVQAGEFLTGNGSMGEIIAKRAQAVLSVGLSEGKPSRHPFHWPLEFPEVFCHENGGFDVMMGNPPFLWGLRISIRISVPFSHFLKREWPHARKNADLCTYFLLRSNLILRATSSAMGFITTKSIAESDNKETSFDYLSTNGLTIFAANTDIRWPGTAMVIVSTVNLFKGTWSGSFSLNGEMVKRISTSLSDEISIGNPRRLLCNKHKCFQGSVPLGDGFFLAEAEANKYLKIGNNKKVIFQYITGKELNNSYSFEPSRWVIYFSDWSLEECKKYPELLSIVRESVKPERDKIIPKNNMARQRKDLWWKFTGPTVDLYRAISANERVLVSAVVGKHHAFAFIPANYIYANTINVFSFNDYEHFIVLQSNFHMAWSLHQGSNLGETPRYNVSDCFETFPFPDPFIDINFIGIKYHNHRRNMMLTRKEGLTTIYNHFNNPNELSEDVKMLRYLHVKMDNIVGAAYGWSDLNLGHGFHQVRSLPGNDCVRFTISEVARLEVLKRLSDVNRQRYEEEVVRVHEKKGKPTSNSRKRSSKEGNGLHLTCPKQTYSSNQPAQLRLPIDEERQLSYGADFSNLGRNGSLRWSGLSAVMSYLRAHPGWHMKKDILAATGLIDSHWNASIADLIRKCLVESQGEGRSTRYRAKKRRGNPDD